MSNITRKEMQEIEVITGVKCDVCGNEKEVDKWHKDTDYVKYSTPSGGWEKVQHVTKNIFVVLSV